MIPGVWMRKCLFPLLFLFSSCVDIPLQEGPATENVVIPYKGLEPGAVEQESAHFRLRAYSSETARKYSDLAEQLYSTVMSDTGLYSFVPGNPYEIIVYRDKAEFVRKTSSPEWSGGITYGNAILLYEHDRYPAILAHEITHLIFNEFMEDYGRNNYFFINEGVAVYEERKAYTESDFYYRGLVDSQVRKAPISFLQMMSYKPLGVPAEVEKWYAQCSSVAEYMLKKEGGFKFYIFLKNLKSGKDIDAAFRDAYPGSWNGYKELEEKWLSSL